MDVWNEIINFGDPTAWPGTPDFRWDNPNKKLKVRSIIIGDIGDPPEIAIRRAGPDNCTPQGPPAALETNANIGLGMYWQAFGSHGDFDGIGHLRRNAQIYARCRGAQTNDNAGGSIHLATTPIGGTVATDRVEIEHDGTLNLSGVPWQAGGGPGILGRVRVRLPNGQVGWLDVKA